MNSPELIPFSLPEPEQKCWRADAHPLTEMKILIVDDDRTNVALLEAMLANAGFTSTKPVLDSRDALELCKTFEPDLLLLDLMMPHVDGFTIIESLRCNDGELLFPIIVLTADVDPKTKLRVLQAGVTDFLTKPLDLAEVLARVTNTLKSRRRNQLIADHRTALELSRDSTSKLRSQLWELENSRAGHVVL
jgi:DNA-binding response OmpR family regulator